MKLKLKFICISLLGSENKQPNTRFGGLVGEHYHYTRMPHGTVMTLSPEQGFSQEKPFHSTEAGWRSRASQQATWGGKTHSVSLHLRLNLRKRSGDPSSEKARPAPHAGCWRQGPVKKRLGAVRAEGKVLREAKESAPAVASKRDGARPPRRGYFAQSEEASRHVPLPSSSRTRGGGSPGPQQEGRGSNSHHQLCPSGRGAPAYRPRCCRRRHRRHAHFRDGERGDVSNAHGLAANRKSRQGEGEGEGECGGGARTEGLPAPLAPPHSEAML
nr:uncharacterized protein LOC129058369 [Pongo abelii]